MKGIAQANNKKIQITLSKTEMPLGRAIGTSLELAEVKKVLDPTTDTQSRELDSCYQQAKKVLTQSSSEYQAPLTEEEFNSAISSGKALEKLRLWMNGIPREQTAKQSFEIRADRQGQITGMDTKKIGFAVNRLLFGSDGSRDQSDTDHSAGLKFSKHLGDSVQVNDLIATIYSSKHQELMPEASESIKSGIHIK
jgi:thymidine phosphorylase